MAECSQSKRFSEENLEDFTSRQKKLCSDEIACKVFQPNDQNLEKTVSTSENENSFVRVSESDVGITEYINDLPGFYAVIKERYSDFIVHEVNLKGNVVRLTDMDKPATSDNRHDINDLLEDEIIQKLHALSDGKEIEVKIEVTDKDKSLRKIIHEALRQNFQGIESLTTENENKKFIIAKKQDVKNKGRRFLPSPAGNYIHFVLYKENRDSMDAINTIASYLRVQPKTFSYAGTKDKRAKTSQLVSAYRLYADRLLSINKKFNMIKVGNIVYKNEQLKLGDLSGNYFTVILRQLNGDPEVIEKSINSIAEKGFLNYYGLQRFGTSSVATHSIGRALLLKDWKGAVNLILQPRLEGDENLANSRKIWNETNDAKKAYQNLRNKSSIEGKLLHGLSSNNENDLVNALNAIPRNTRLLYIHSYQSFVWNRVLSERIKKHGLKVLPGDLVSSNPNVAQEEILESEKSERKIMLSSCVKYVSENEVSNFSISDVLLPLPGHSVMYPNNECKDWYETFLKSDGIEWSDFNSKVKTYALSGAYRQIVVIPSDVSWEIMSYDDVNEPLALSDLDTLLHQQNLEIKNSGSKKALKIEFKLPPSCYATMAIREILKCSTAYSSKKT